jgi:hypothetical protein
VGWDMNFAELSFNRMCTSLKFEHDPKLFDGSQQGVHITCYLGPEKVGSSGCC